SNKPPSIPFLRDAAHKGLIDPHFAFTMEDHIVSQAREQANEARLESREAARDANEAFNATVAGLIALRQTGDLGDASPEADLQLLRSGRLGPMGDPVT